MIPSSALTQWEGRTFLSVKVNVSAPCIRKEAISPLLSLFLARSPCCVFIYSIPAFTISPAGPYVTLRRVKFCRSENLFATCQWPYYRVSIFKYIAEARGPSNVNSDPGVLNCPFPKYSNLDYYAATRRNGCATFEFLKFWKSSLIFFFFFRNKNDGKKNRLREILNIYISICTSNGRDDRFIRSVILIKLRRGDGERRRPWSPKAK